MGRVDGWLCVCLAVCLALSGSGVPGVCADAFNPCSPCFVRQSLSVNRKLAHLTVSRQQARGRPFISSACLAWGLITGADAGPGLLPMWMDARGLNPGSHVCAASILLTEPQSDPYSFSSIKYILVKFRAAVSLECVCMFIKMGRFGENFIWGQILVCSLKPFLVEFSQPLAV